MDVIYTDSARVEIGVLKRFYLDVAVGDENDFEVEMGIGDFGTLTNGSCIILDGTEIGGIISGVRVNTGEEKVYHTGQTWEGVLSKHIVQPSGDYYTATGDVHTVISSLITSCNLVDTFKADSELAGSSVSAWKFDRYCTLYDGIRKMLESVGRRMSFAWSRSDKKVIITTKPISTYPEAGTISSDQVSMTIERDYAPVNHLICLGSGELSNRQVIHLYLQSNGSIGNTPYYTGGRVVESVYDCANAESSRELDQGGRKRFAELLVGDSVSVTIQSDDACVGDMVYAEEVNTGVVVKKQITKKIVTMSDNATPKVEYEVK